MSTDEKMDAARKAWMATRAVVGAVWTEKEERLIRWAFAEGWALAEEARRYGVGDVKAYVRGEFLKTLDDGLFAQPAPELDPGDLFYKAQVEAAGGTPDMTASEAIAREAAYRAKRERQGGVELREGQWYRRRDEEIVGPAEKANQDYEEPWAIAGKYYHSAQRGSWLGGGRVTVFDLVDYAEAPEAGR